MRVKTVRVADAGSTFALTADALLSRSWPKDASSPWIFVFSVLKISRSVSEDTPRLSMSRITWRFSVAGEYVAT